MSYPFSRAGLASAAVIALLAAMAPGVALAQDTTPATPPAAAAPAVDPAAVVATINGQDITEADLSVAIGDLDQQFAQLPPEQRRAAALSAVIEIRLLAARAIEQGFDKDEEFKRRNAFLQQRALHSEVVEKDIAAKLTDDEVRAQYDKQISETPPVNEVRARHILVKTKEEAEAIVKELDGGADFEKLAAEKTNDPSGKSTGGDLGYFGPGQMVPEFEKAAFALEVGAYTKEPVESQFGFHVIKLEDRRERQPPAFEQVKDQVRQILFRDRYFALVKDVRDAAKVEIADPALKEALAKMEAQ